MRSALRMCSSTLSRLLQTLSTLHTPTHVCDFGGGAEEIAWVRHRCLVVVVFRSRNLAIDEHQTQHHHDDAPALQKCTTVNRTKSPQQTFHSLRLAFIMCIRKTLVPNTCRHTKCRHSRMYCVLYLLAGVCCALCLRPNVRERLAAAARLARICLASGQFIA